MSYVKLNIENLEESQDIVRKAWLKQDKIINEVKEKVKVCQAEARRSRKLLAVDSGFNSAYESPFSVFKAVVVDEEIRIEQSGSIYLFHVDNYKTDRLRRLLMQQALYEALAKTVKTDRINGSMVLVDGTITLKVFYPTVNDSNVYKEHFKNLNENLYTPLLNQCIKREILVLGFLKRTGSTYLAHHLGVKGIYDPYIMYSMLDENGLYIPPIPIVDSQANIVGVNHKYATFYLNLKNWVYRFELLRQQEKQFLEAIENLLFWATKTHYGMNPIFSKADEYSRVTKREANLKFNYFVQGLSEDNQIRLILEARKRTHFGY